MKNLLKTLVLGLLFVGCTADSIVETSTDLERKPSVENAECVGNIDIDQFNKDKITGWLNDGYIDFFGGTYDISYYVNKQRGTTTAQFGYLPTHFDIDNDYPYATTVYRLGLFNEDGELVQEGCITTGYYVSRFYVDVKRKGNYTLVFLDYPDVTRVFNVVI